MPQRAIARVAFNVRVYGTFDYTLPAGTDAAAIVGCRVRAPFGNRTATGVVLDVGDDSDLSPNKIKTITAVYSDMPALPQPLLALIRFCSDYYHCPIGITVATALPTFFRRANEFHLPKKHAADVTPAEAPATRHHPPLQLPPLTDDQQAAIAALQLNAGFSPHLLFGKTGSGKTAVYLHAIHDRLVAGKQVLLLTPEIHLIPQLQAAVTEQFPHAQTAVLHSGLSDGERASQWLRAAHGHTSIVLGTRLAVWTPLPRLGLVVIDEEHDESYKQEDRLPFSAKNLAIWRAQHEAVAYIAGSATPSLESVHRHAPARVLPMQQRAIATGKPRFHFVDDDPASSFHGLQKPFIDALREHLQQDRQALIFINRRGYAPVLFCDTCQRAIECANCSTTLTVHKQRHSLMCHHCGAVLPLPTHCASCNRRLTARGSGTQRIEHALAKLFPDYLLRRLDRDTNPADAFVVEDGGASDIATNRTRIIIGTQMIAKGHNFPHLSFIGLLNTDRCLYAVDFRAEERAFAMLSQVVGRGTRNPRGCDVYIQTRHATHPFYQALANDEVMPCWQRLLAERQAAGLPPFAYLALLRARAKTAAAVEAFMVAAITSGRAVAGSGVTVYDAVPPVLEKVGGQHRRQCLIHSHHRGRLHAFLKNWRAKIPHKNTVHWSLDIDPTTV